MSKLKLEGNASGTGVITLTAPNTDVDRTITLPDSAGSLLDTTSTLDATKLSGALPALDGSGLTGISAGNPIGTVIEYLGDSAPTGFLVIAETLTNISRATYADLFAVIGTKLGVGDGSTTFGLWMPAGYALIHGGGTLGGTTVGENLTHTHPMRYTAYLHSNIGANINTDGQGGPTTNTNSSGGAANLAAGVRVLMCIKYT